VLLLKTDLDGDTLWSRHFGGEKNEVAFWISLFPGGEILLTGETEGFGTNNFDAYVIRIDSNGNTPCPGTVSFETDTNAVCEDQTVFFTNTTVSSQPFTWAINNDPFSNDIDAAYYFNESGNYEVKLSACTASATQTLDVLSKPPASFSYTAEGNTVSFVLDTSITPSTIVWNFGDGSIADSVNWNPVHTYASQGMYWVTLTVTTNNSCDSTYIDQIDVFTGIGDPGVAASSLFISPNPVRDATEIICNESVSLPLPFQSKM
jgi:hypothetical protein